MQIKIVNSYDFSSYFLEELDLGITFYALKKRLKTQSNLQFHRKYVIVLVWEKIYYDKQGPIFSKCTRGKLNVINWLNLKLVYYEVLFTNPSARAGYDTRSIFKRSLTGLNSEFSFSKTSCLTKAEEPSPSYYLSIAGGRIRGFIPFPRVFARK